VQPDAAVNGRVWGDDNVNGVWEQDERAVADVLSIRIYNTTDDGAIVAQATLNESGAWSIENLYPGSYRVIAVALGDTLLTTPSVYTIQLESGQTLSDLNFGTTQRDPSQSAFRVYVPTIQRTQ